MDKEDRDYWLINFSVTTASSEHSNYLYNSSVESIKTSLMNVKLSANEILILAHLILSKLIVGIVSLLIKLTYFYPCKQRNEHTNFSFIYSRFIFRS